MKYRRLGRSGLKVSEISLGTFLTYGGYVDDDKAIRTTEQAYELGVNFFDTANVYERGKAEVVLGRALKRYPRESYVLATKVFWPMGDGPNDRGLSRKHIMEQAHASLKRLDTDYVDIYYCHRFDPHTPVDETLRALDDLVRSGKVLYIGVSEWTAANLAEGLAVSERYLLDRIIVNQPVYHMFNRYIEKEVLPFCQSHGISQVVYSPLAEGILTGKYQHGQAIPADSRAANRNWVAARFNKDQLDKAAKLGKLAAEAGMKLPQLALAWILRQDNVASALIGASKPEQVVENCTASDIQLTADTLEAVEAILAEA